MEKKVEKEKKVEEEKNEEINKGDEQEQSVHVTQLPPPSPPHSTFTPIERIKIKDITNTSSQNINPLTAEDLTKILDQLNQQAQLCTNPILVVLKSYKSQ